MVTKALSKGQGWIFWIFHIVI